MVSGRGEGSWHLPHSPRFLHAGPPTDPLPIEESLRYTPYRDPRRRADPEKETTARAGLDLAVRVGELLLRCGAGTRDVEASVVAVAAAAGLRRLEIDITNQALLVQVPAPHAAPITMLRVVRSSTRDFARLSAVHRFVEGIVENGLPDIDSASQELRSIQRMPRLYPRWIRLLAFAGLAGSVCTLLGGGLTAVIVSMIAAVLVDRANLHLNKWRLPPFFQAAVGGGIATLCAWLAYVVAAHTPLGQMSSNDFAFAVASGIVLLLPGQAMTSAVEDGITGYPVTGAGRLLTVFLTCSGIVIGIAFGLSVTLRLDSAMSLKLSSPQSLHFAQSTATLRMQILGGLLGAFCSAISNRSQIRHLVPAAILGATGAAVANLLSGVAGVGSTTAIAIAAIVVGMAGRLFALRLGAPALVLVVPAVSPMLPGLRIFRGMYEAVSGNIVGTVSAANSTAIATLIGAAGIALAISSGAVLGDVLSAPFDRREMQRRRFARRR